MYTKLRIIGIGLLLLVMGCTIPTRTPTATYDEGPTPDQLKHAVASQRESAATIERAAITSKSNVNDEVVVTAEQDRILREVEALLKSTNIFSLEHYAKTSWLHERDNLYAKIDMLTQQLEETNAQLRDLTETESKALVAILRWMTIIGTLMIPLGIILAVKLDPQLGWLSVMGVFLIVAVKVSNWAQQNWAYIAMGSFVVMGLAWWRAYRIQQIAIAENVATTEQLKAEVKAIPIEDEQSTDPRKNPQVILHKVFGDKHHDGLASTQSETTKRIVLRERKKLAQKWAPVIPT